MGDRRRRDRSAVRGLAIACTALLPAIAAAAESFPTHALKVIVPYPAGGVVDTLIRSVSREVSDRLGQPVVVENRPGGNNIVALQACARAPADGYTVCAASADGISFNPYLYPQLPYDPERDFTPVTQLVWVNGAIVANAKVLYDSVTGMVAYARQHPKVVNFASFGAGSTPHLFLEWFRRQGDVDITHVPYKGAAQIVPALLSGEVDATFLATGFSLPLIRGGKLKALAVTGPTRSPHMPDVSTLAEQGLDPRIRNWFGVFCPAGTAAVVVERLNGAFAGSVKSPHFRAQFLDAQDYDPVGSAPGEFERFLKTDRDNAKAIIERTGIRLSEPGSNP